MYYALCNGKKHNTEFNMSKDKNNAKLVKDTYLAAYLYQRCNVYYELSQKNNNL